MVVINPVPGLGSRARIASPRSPRSPAGGATLSPKGRPVTPGQGGFPKPPSPQAVALSWHTTLETATTCNRAIVYESPYQENFQQFQRKVLDKHTQVILDIKHELEEEGNLETLRDLYSKVVETKNNYQIETRLFRSLQRRIETLFVREIKEAKRGLDFTRLEALLKEASEEPLMKVILKAVDLDAIRDDLPSLRERSDAEAREGFDDSARLRSPSPRSGNRKEASRCSIAVVRTRRTAHRLPGWEHIFFDIANGHCHLITEIQFDRSKSLYLAASPKPQFLNSEQAEAVLREVVKLYTLFQVPLTVRQGYKASNSLAYRSKGYEAGDDHDSWLERLAQARAEGIRCELVHQGVPEEQVRTQAFLLDDASTAQVIEFDLKLEYVQYAEGRLNLLSDIEYEPRRYNRDKKDTPDTQLMKRDRARACAREVCTLATIFGGELAIVTHCKMSQELYDDEHGQWLKDLAYSKAERMKEVLLEVGLATASIRAMPVDGEDHGSLHFELLTPGRQVSGEATGRRERDRHSIQVQGAGVHSFNGLYRPVGTKGGRTKYRHEDGGANTITYGNGFWFMCYRHSIDQDVAYKARGADQHPPTDSWRRGFRGQDPSPTVTVHLEQGEQEADLVVVTLPRRCSCGTLLDDDATTCRRCGKRVEDGAGSALPQSPRQQQVQQRSRSCSPRQQVYKSAARPLAPRAPPTSSLRSASPFQSRKAYQRQVSWGAVQHEH